LLDLISEKAHQAAVTGLLHNSIPLSSRD